MAAATVNQVRNFTSGVSDIPDATIESHLADAADWLTDQNIQESHRSYSQLQIYWCLHLMSSAGLFNVIVAEHVADVQTSYVNSPDADANYGTSWGRLFYKKIAQINKSKAFLVS